METINRQTGKDPMQLLQEQNDAVKEQVQRGILQKKLRETEALRESLEKEVEQKRKTIEERSTALMGDVLDF